MSNLRGFNLAKKRIKTLTRRVFRRRVRGHFSSGFRCSSAASRLCDWGRRLKASLCSASTLGGSNRGYIPLGGDEEKKPGTVPKGHLAVYVGVSDGDFERVLLPVMYFNHPLFGKLLREAEEKYGFNHPGGITIPCPISDFQSIRTRIAAVHGGRRMARRKTF